MLDEATLALMVDRHVRNRRQGPGSDAVFAQALALSGIDTNTPLHIADIGCGTGVASIALAQKTHAHITAVDFVPAFLTKLEADAQEAGVSDRITTCVADMGDLPFAHEQFDVIWSEGAIYNIGFARGIEAWRTFLKPSGVLVVTEITWRTPDVPDVLRAYWEGVYPEIACASTKLGQLECAGYTPTGYFVLPPQCWQDEYYAPLEAGTADFLARHRNSAEANAVVAEDEEEMKLYATYHAYYSYGCYVAKKRG